MKRLAMGSSCEPGSAASRGPRLPLAFYLAVRRSGARFSRDVLWVRTSRQQLVHFRAVRAGKTRCQGKTLPEYVPAKGPLVASTSRFGTGQERGSNRTPLGLHRVALKIGGGWPVGAVFRNRKQIGFTWKGHPNGDITTRILWLEGLEPGLNRGGRVDSFQRYIYIHGTGNELALGKPASLGCIHLAARDLLPLYDALPRGTLVWVAP